MSPEPSFSACGLNWRVASQLPRSGRSSLPRHFLSRSAFDVEKDQHALWIVSDLSGRIDACSASTGLSGHGGCRSTNAVEGKSRYQRWPPCIAPCLRGRQTDIPEPRTANSRRAISQITRSAISVRSALSPNEKTRGRTSNTHNAPSRIFLR